MRFRIPLNKGDTCPVCEKKIRKPNCWVRYHVSYKPEMVVLACKFCNWTEYFMRSGIPSGRISKKRVEKIRKFQKRFNVTI